MELVKLLRLDRPDKDGRVPIHLRVCWQGHKVRFSSGEKVHPKDWKDDKVKGSAQYAIHINKRLRVYDDKLHDYFYTRQNQGEVITEEQVRIELERIRVDELGKKVAESVAAPAPLTPSLITPYEFVERYVQERRADRSDAWAHSMGVVGRHLHAFRPGLTWDGLTLSTLNMFKVYLLDEEGISDKTLEAYIGLLRGMLKYAGRSSMPVPGDYIYMEGRKPGDAILPELSHAEIKQLLNAKLDPTVPHKRNWPGLNTDAMEDTRWYFVVACSTGLRHSDLWQLQSPRITYIESTPCLEIVQQKTRKKVPIPLFDDVYHLIKNPVSSNPPIERAQYNTLLKDIAEQTGLNRSVLIGSYHRGELLSEYLPLYDTVSSHMARRTFATLMTAGGMPTKTLQEIMGHQSIASTAKYAKVSSPQIVHQVLDAWKQSQRTR